MKTKKLGKPAKYGEPMNEKLFIRFTKADFRMIASKAKQAGYVSRENGTSSFARDLLLQAMSK